MNKVLGVQTMQHTFKGTANKHGPDWSIGFDQGRQFALDNFNPNTGGYNRDLPTLFNPRADDYNSGFAEGLLSGCAYILDTTFGDYKSIHWVDSKPVVTK